MGHREVDRAATGKILPDAVAFTHPNACSRCVAEVLPASRLLDSASQESSGNLHTCASRTDSSARPYASACVEKLSVEFVPVAGGRTLFFGPVLAGVGMEQTEPVQHILQEEKAFLHRELCFGCSSCSVGLAEGAHHKTGAASSARPWNTKTARFHPATGPPGRPV